MGNPRQHSNESASKDADSLCFGLVAWLDVLGFKSLLCSNEDKAGVWIEVLSFLKKSKAIQEQHQPSDFQLTTVGLTHDDYKVTAFADTIVTSVDLSQAGSDKQKQWHRIGLFLKRNAYLCRQMLDYGLPIRGGISIGKFFHSPLGFAGKPFVDAEALSSQLELSACVLSSDCMDYIKNLYRGRVSNLDSNFLWLEHLCETKSEPAGQDFSVLNCFAKGVIKATNDAADIHSDLTCGSLADFVATSFSAHGKAIDHESVKRKIANTTRMLETFKRQYPLFA